MDLRYLPQSERLLSGHLSLALNDSDTTTTMDTPPDVNALPTYIEIDPDGDTPETVRAIDVAGNVVTIERGIYNGGVGLPHNNNVSYKQKVASVAWQAIVTAIESGYITEDTAYVFSRLTTASFRVAGVDRTSYYTAGRKVRLNGSVLVDVISSAYSGGNTNVTVSQTTVPATITSIELGIAPLGATDLYTIILSLYKASGSDINTGTDDNKLVTSKAIADSNIAFLADIPVKSTGAEIKTGTEDGKFNTPKGLVDAGISTIKVVQLVVFDPSTDVDIGDGKILFRVPVELNGFNLVGVAMCVYTAGTTGTTDVQLRNVTDAVDMLSTKLTIDSTEVDSSTGATPAVIDTTKDDVATGDRIAVDVDATSTTKAKGLLVELRFQKP